MKRRSRMDLNSIKRTILAAVGVLALSSVNAVAQEIRSEISLQGTGFFTKDAYGYDRNTQIYFGRTGARVESNTHQITGSAVVKLPSFARLQPYALAGGGALVFDPTGNAGGNFAGATTETRGAFVYGAGADYAFTRHISLRAEYRGYVYKAPDFNLAGLNTDSWTHIAQPSAGIVFRF